jgi:hypothetical protein
VTRLLHELERVESRALAALRFVDAATDAPVTTPLEVRVLDGSARLVRNVRGDLVVAAWSELAAHEAAFAQPPATPALGTRILRMTVTDPGGAHLPRAAALALPRDPDPEHASSPDSVFRAAEIRLYPSARAATGANWGVLRATVRESGGDALGGALLLVRRNGGVLGRGLTDGRGEALVALPGVPMVTFGEDDEAVVVTELAVTVQVVFDPSTGTRMAAVDLAAGRPAPIPIVDPEALEDGAGALPETSLAISIAARRSQNLAMTLDLP